MWDRRFGRLLHTYRGASQVYAVAFDPSGDHFWMNDGLGVTRHTVVYRGRENDPLRLLERAESAAGMRLDGMRLIAR